MGVVVVVLITMLVAATALASLILLDELPSWGVDNADGAVGSRNLNLDGSLSRRRGRLSLVGSRENGGNLELAIAEGVEDGGLADIGEAEEGYSGRLLLALGDLAESSEKLFPSGPRGSREEIGGERKSGNPSLESLTRDKI